MGDLVLEKLHMRPRKRDMQPWRSFLKQIRNNLKKEVNIAVVGKYFSTGKFELADSYVSVIESLKHAAWNNKVKPKLTWINSMDVEKRGAKNILQKYDGIVVPGGFGSRGTEGMIDAVEYARKNNVPFLGLCYGMQMATIEFARNVAKMRTANTTEVDLNSKYPVIHIMPDQEKKLLKKDYGGTMRLGSWDCILKKGSRAEALYGERRISERHRHRYEINNKFRPQLEKLGFIFSGTSPDGKLAEIIEIPTHKFFVGCQFHPEYKSRPMKPHPLFNGFVKALLKKK
jgi:CTP synthase